MVWGIFLNALWSKQISQLMAPMRFAKNVPEIYLSLDKLHHSFAGRICSGVAYHTKEDQLSFVLWLHLCSESFQNWRKYQTLWRYWIRTCLCVLRAHHGMHHRDGRMKNPNWDWASVHCPWRFLKDWLIDFYFYCILWVRDLIMVTNEEFSGSLWSDKVAWLWMIQTFHKIFKKDSKERWIRGVNHSKKSVRDFFDVWLQMIFLIFSWFFNFFLISLIFPKRCTWFFRMIYPSLEYTFYFLYAA